MDALVEGTLTDDQGCIGILTAEGENYVLSLPRGTEWTPPDTITLGEARLRVGERASLGGGHLGSVDQYRATDAVVPEFCPGDAVVWKVG